MKISLKTHKIYILTHSYEVILIISTSCISTFRLCPSTSEGRYRHVLASRGSPRHLQMEIRSRTPIIWKRLWLILTLLSNLPNLRIIALSLMCIYKGLSFLIFKVFFNKFIFFYLFIYFWLCWVFVAAHRLSLVAASGGYSSLRCAGFSLRWLLLLRSMDSRWAGFSSCGTRAQ